MPLILDDIDLSSVQAKKKAVNATFFTSKFTGNGQRRSGLLGPDLVPTPSTNNTAYLAEAGRNIETRSTKTQHGISVRSVPINVIARRALALETVLPGSSPIVPGDFTLPVPHEDFLHEIELSGSNLTAYFSLTPQGAKHFEDTATGDKKMPREFIVQYRMELFLAADGVELPERAPIVFQANLPRINQIGTVADIAWSVDPLNEAEAFVDDALSRVGAVRADTSVLTEWMTQSYVVHDAIVHQAELWTSEAIADEVCAYIEGIPDAPATETLRALCLQLRYLENYVIPLEAYGRIHRAIEKKFDAETASTLSKQNVNLLMSHQLYGLDAIKDQLAVPGTVPSTYAPAPFLSQQQREAVCTHEPLVMAQAGAGTGKSTVILERIQYLQASGVDPKDITVLSFTNIAADNITAKNPDVGSMTIARMIHDIYSLNHQTHELSSIDTILNTLGIHFPNDSFALEFRARLLAIDKNETGSVVAMNSFIERNYEKVIDTLDKIQQTTLELEIIICYQRIDEMNEPPHVACRHLIIDEVQDNSIFEFVYVLKYIAKHLQSLFIVGDASQTLYEFRSANPRALNTLEGSGVFTTYRLTTNYRSNQEILDFANVVLGDLETNQIANIQLQANALDVPTADSFREKVRLDYRETRKPSEFVGEELANAITGSIKVSYIDQCLARGEQVAFLGHSRREVAVIEAALSKAYPNRHVANLVSDRPYPTDIFSKYILHFWNDVRQVRVADAAFTAAKGIDDNLHKLTNKASSKGVRSAILAMRAKWWEENKATIRGWEQMVNQGLLPHPVFFDRLRDNMLNFEIRHNAVRQSLIQQKNAERKKKNAEAKSELVVSTIHGAKGMEFENVVVVHKEDPLMSQDKRRMFYVAFTRAMKSELILSYGKEVDAPIQSSYDLIVDALAKRDLHARAVALGIDPEVLEESEKENGAITGSPFGAGAMSAA